MKGQDVFLIDNESRVLSIVAGQFLIIVLKGDVGAITLFRKGYIAHFRKLFGVLTQEELEKKTVTAGRDFVAILAKHFGWESNAAECLSECVESTCHAWLSDGDISPYVEKLRIIDAWSGIASCTVRRPVIPLSLLDYILMLLLPIVCGQEIRVAVKSLADFGADNNESLEAVDEALTACVSRLCCGIRMNESMLRELKLAVLLHLPKDNGFLSANEGMAYKMLQCQYANMGENQWKR